MVSIKLNCYICRCRSQRPRVDRHSSHSTDPAVATERFGCCLKPGHHLSW